MGEPVKAGSTGQPPIAAAPRPGPRAGPSRATITPAPLAASDDGDPGQSTQAVYRPAIGLLDCGGRARLPAGSVPAPARGVLRHSGGRNAPPHAESAPAGPDRPQSDDRRLRPLQGSPPPARGSARVSSAPRDCVGDGTGFVWLGLKDPTEEEIARRARLRPPRAGGRGRTEVEHQRPKLDDHERPLLPASSRRPGTTRSQGGVHFGEIHVFLGPRYVITIRHGEAASLRTGPRRHLEQEHPSCSTHGPASVVWAILDQVVDDYEPVVAGIDDDIEEVEQASSRAAPSQTAADLLPEARGDRVPPGGGAPARPAGGPRARRVSRRCPRTCGGSSATSPSRARRIDEQVNSQRELLTSILEANLSLISVQPERGRPGDLGLGGDHRGADLPRVDLGHELRAHARAAPHRLGYPLALVIDASRDPGAPPLLQADRVAVGPSVPCRRSERGPRPRRLLELLPVPLAGFAYAKRASTLAAPRHPRCRPARQLAFAAGLL